MIGAIENAMKKKIQTKIDVENAYGKAKVAGKNQKKLQQDAKNELQVKRQEFNKYLALVYKEGTNEQGVMLVSRFIKENSGDQEVLKIILHALCNKGTINSNSESDTKINMSFHVSFFGYLA